MPLSNFFCHMRPYMVKKFSPFTSHKCALHKGLGVFRFVPPADSPRPFFSLNFRRLLKIFGNLRKFKMKKYPRESAGGTSRNTPKPL